MKILIGLTLLAAPMFAAAVTSAQAGPWSSTSTWTGGVVPGNGDTVTMTHEVTVDVATTVGDSPVPGSTPVIQINAGGRLICSTPGVELKVRGEIRWAQPSVAATHVIDWTSCTLSIDPSLAADRTTAIYTIGPISSSTGNARLRFAGTTANPAIVQTLRPNGDEARAAFSRNGFTSVGMQTNANGFHFIDLGSASLRAIDADTTSFFHFENGTFTRCGIVGLSTSSFSATGDFAIDNVVFEDSLATTNIYFNSGVTLTSGYRSISRSYFDKQLMGGSPGVLLNVTMDHNVFAERPGVAGFWASFNNNFMHMTGNTGMLVPGHISNFFIYNSAGASNAKELQISNAANRTIDGAIIQVGFQSGSGDAIVVVSNAGSGVTATIRNTIILPASDLPNKSSGTVVATGVTSNPPNIVLENNIMHGGNGNPDLTGSGACADYSPFLSEGVGGSQTARADTITSYRGNILWDSKSDRALKAHHGCTQNSVINDNILSPGNAEYNACFNCGLQTIFGGKANQGTFYWFPMTGTTPGNGDVNENPHFVDPTRNLETWAAARGISPATHVGVLAALKAGDRSQMIPDLINWVRQGFAPRNLRLVQSAAPNSRIGAVRPILMFGTMGVQ